MEPTVQPKGHVCAKCGAVTGSPNAEPKLWACPAIEPTA